MLLLLVLNSQLLTSCAKEASKKIHSKRLKKTKKLVSVLHTYSYFKKGSFGEEFVIEAQLRSLSRKPLRHIILNVHLFDKAGNLISSRREGVKWVKNKRRLKRLKYKKESTKGLLYPGEKNVCKIVFYASQLEPESKLEKEKRQINKKFSRPRKANFTSVFPKKFSISVHSAEEINK